MTPCPFLQNKTEHFADEWYSILTKASTISFDLGEQGHFSVAESVLQ